MYFYYIMIKTLNKYTSWYSTCGDAFLPLWLTQCEENNGSYYADCDQYIVNTLRSHPLTIAFTKQQNIIAISSILTLTKITSVPFYMALNIDAALILSPNENVLEAQNGNTTTDCISNDFINEETSHHHI